VALNLGLRVLLVELAGLVVRHLVPSLWEVLCASRPR
jgi:hypothetical protein